IALEVEHEQPRPRALALGPRTLLALTLLLLLLRVLLEALLAVYHALHGVGGVLEAAIEVHDLEALGLSATPCRRDDEGDDQQQHDEKGRELREEEPVVGEKSAHPPARPTLSRANTRSAR